MGIFGDDLPGETPIDDTSLLRLPLQTRQELNVAEAKNVRWALVKYLAAKPSRRMAPFDYGWMLRLHREMFGDVWSYAGQLRQHNVNIGLPWQQIASSLQQLVGDLEYWEQQWPDVVEQATWLHHRAVQIHPFAGGNGRWSRLLANIWLKQHDHQVTHWPEADLQGSSSPVRQEYLQAVRAADTGDRGPLLELHRRFSA